MVRNTKTTPIFHGFIIYALVDPRDNLIRYVGITDNLYSRVGAHLRETGSRTAKGKWLAELNAENLLPLAKELEQVKVSRKERYLAEERERYWIEYYKKAGMPLLNVIYVDIGKERISPVKLSRQKYYKKQVSTIDELRKRAGLRLEELAELSDVSYTSLRKMIRGEKVSKSLVERVLKVLSRQLGRNLFFDNIRGINYLEY
jgi:predicted GIY-YIG superfamily endonuclease/DNA-binding transcriptional regulator YiaG